MFGRPKVRLDIKGNRYVYLADNGWHSYTIPKNTIRYYIDNDTLACKHTKPQFSGICESCLYIGKEETKYDSMAVKAKNARLAETFRLSPEEEQAEQCKMRNWEDQITLNIFVCAECKKSVCTCDQLFAGEELKKGTQLWGNHRYRQHQIEQRQGNA